MERDVANKESTELLELVKENETLRVEQRKLENTILQSTDTIKKYNTSINVLNKK